MVGVVVLVQEAVEGGAREAYRTLGIAQPDMTTLDLHNDSSIARARECRGVRQARTKVPCQARCAKQAS